MHDFGNRWLCLLSVVVLVGCGQTAPPVKAPAVPLVEVSQPIADKESDYEDFIGRTDAVSRVEIRARVSGYLVKVNFKDGDIVKQGDLLYKIDARPFQAALDQAKADIERLDASKKLLTIQVERYKTLAAKGAASQQDLDEYLAKQAENIGALKAAEAKAEQAQLNLEFTEIKAPVTGQISRTLLTEGNLVIADNTLLTTVVSINPMYAYFDVEEPTMLRIRRMKRDGTLPAKMDAVEVRMGLADDVERKFPLKGWLDFANNTVDAQTGTIQIRGRFENGYKLPEQPPLLVPGLFVRVRLRMSAPHPVLLVNDRAIGTDQGEKFVYVVDHENKVGYRRVKLGKVFDGLRAVEEGLQPGDRVVVNGLQRVRPGIQVQPELVEMKTLAVKK
jgi:RND family efflux transporter MFP subunit